MSVLPHPLPGLWKEEMGSGTDKHYLGDLCVGASLPAPWTVFDGKRSGPECRIARRRDADQGVIDAVCKFDFTESSGSMRTRLTGTARSLSMTVDIESKFLNGPASSSHEAASYTYVGPCPPKLKEGQLEQPDGTIIDLSN